MKNPQLRINVFLRHIALPQDHGSWVFLLSPLLIGLFIGRSWSVATIFLIIASFSAFLIRQPITIAVKVYSGRKSRHNLGVVWFWILTYCLIGSFSIIGLIFQGFGFLLYLVLIGIPVFIWHLYLVSNREERRQVGVEIVASGVFALAAPAAYWIGKGYQEQLGWVLFVLVWLQSAASIVHAYMRLEQRTLNPQIGFRTKILIGRRALLYTTFNLVLVSILSGLNYLPSYLPLPYFLQWGETLCGALRPASGVKPTIIGFRQLSISSLFTVLFILTWCF